MTSLTFCQALVDEGAYLTELSLRSKSFWGYSSVYVEQCRQYLTIDNNYINSWPVIVLKLNTAIIGFYALRDINNEHRLDKLWLEPSYIRQGYGTSALQHAFHTVKLLGWDHFFVVSEPKAVPFYKKFGGTVVGEIQSMFKSDLQLPHLKFTLRN
jgi:GNAT superfamily N-acetyltransferase